MFLRQSINPTLGAAFASAIVAAFKAVPGAALVSAPVVKLWKDIAFEPVASTAATEFDAAECDFTDYVAKMATLSDEADLSENSVGDTATVSWIVEEAGAVTGNTVYGYWVENAAGDVILFERFADGDEVPMGEDGAQLILVVAIPIPLATTGLVEQA